MPRPYPGAGGWGALRYEIAGEPVAALHCQCRSCQKQSGTGHASFVVFAGRSGMRIDGETSVWRFQGDGGTDKFHAFCSTCGGAVHVAFAAAPDIVAVYPGSLDEPSRFDPTFVTYGFRGEAWDALDPGLTVFERMPPG